MSGLFVIFFECAFQKENYTVKSIEYSDYSSKEKFDELKKSHADLAFTRHDNKILYWKLGENSNDNLNGEIVTVSATKNPRVFLKVFETALIHRLDQTTGYRVRHDKYSHIWRITKEEDLLKSQIEGMAFHQQICINTVCLEIDKQLLFGVVISAGIEHRFTWGRKEFELHGIDTSGLKGKGDVVFANRHALKHFFAARGLEGEYERKINQLNSNEKQLGVINSFFGWIDKIKQSLYLPNENKLVSISRKYLPYSGITREVLSQPKRFYFGGRTNEQGGLNYNEQVKKYKPFSFELFSSNPVKLGIICPRQFEGVAEGFLNRLENILRNDLHIKKVEFYTCYIKDANSISYKEVLYDTELLKSNLIMVIVTDDHLKLPPQNSPYYFCKAKYIGNGIPTQDIQVKNIKSLNPYVLNNISLNIYAKLGGTAWTVEKEEKRKEELVIGIGSTIDETGKHVLGIAQIFHSDGRYLVGECAPLSSFENYTENLKEYLLQALNKIIDNHINKQQEFRLVFHLFKSASNRYEIQAVNDVIQNFQDLTFKYALVHLGYGHNFRLFNDDGKQTVAKGMYVKLENDSALLHFIPDSCLPLYIQLDRRSTFKDLYYLSKQIFWFANLSHRSYIPAKRTVTIIYPSLMAEVTEKLKQVDGWDYDRLKSISEKLWFI